ncbi:MAG: hypothetical protein BZ151_10810 [Desulfobacca sp. 4484_104]|nr:MAG: hypothetical protein BZ151_10810 [Desulfobacca sp. 4484_104]RLB69323.1 MAG: stress-induced protein YgiW [Deltaproteobacteria bacterium]
MFRKFFLIIAVLLLATSVYAGFKGPGTIPKLETVQSIKSLHDDANVTLEGHLIKKIKEEHYLFKDDTGEIEIEIDDEDFRGVQVTPQTKVRIVGEVDRDKDATTIDADYLEVIK